MFDVLELHRRLAAAARPSGTEQSGVAKVLADAAAPFVDEINTDAMGNLICHRRGDGPRILLAAHMDAIGFIVTYIDKNGFLNFDRIGGHSPAELINCRVVFPNGVHGVIRPKESAKTLSGKWKDVSLTKLYLDIGAAGREEAEQLVKIGDMAAFEGLPEEVAGGNIMGPYADDLIGCVTLLLALEQLKDRSCDLYCVFTTQEEVGCRGALAAAQSVCPQIGIACDVCGVSDTPERDKTPSATVLGKGPTIKIKDASVICSPGLNAALRQTAGEAGIPWQDEILTGGGTDTSSIQRSGGDVAATCISIPTRHIHSPAETYCRSDVEQAGRLLAAYLSRKQEGRA